MYHTGILNVRLAVLDVKTVCPPLEMNAQLKVSMMVSLLSIDIDSTPVTQTVCQRQMYCQSLRLEFHLV